MRLACAMLYVKDLPRMRNFYQQMLGAESLHTEWTDTWALFDAGDGVRFALHAIPAGIAESISISSPPEPRESSPVKLIFAVDNVPEERQRLEALGITMLQRPWQGSDQCDGIDPEGNIFQISSHRI